MGFDFGTKRIGVAVGQTTTATAQALTTVTCRTRRSHWQAIGELIRQWQPDAFVVGWPTHADGKDHALWPQIEAFCRQLSSRWHRPVYKINEHLSSFEAESYARDSHRAPVKDTDSTAAQIILDSWLRQNS